MEALPRAVLDGPCRPAPPGIASQPDALRPSTDDVWELTRAARRIRRSAVEMIGTTGLGYLGQATSSADLFAVLYLSAMRHGTDRFVLSPGHYAITHYAAAAEAGLLDAVSLATYGADGSWLESISTERTPLVSATCGALGQGLSVAVGLALADALAGDDERRTYVVASDGETEEGQTWEAAMFAAHRRLGALTVVVDCNNSQVDGPVTSVTTLEPLAAKWEAFGWHTVDVDGHDIGCLVDAFGRARGADRPSVILARTRMLEGLPSLTGRLDAHFVTLTPTELARALVDVADDEADRHAQKPAAR